MKPNTVIITAKEFWKNKASDFVINANDVDGATINVTDMMEAYAEAYHKAKVKETKEVKLTSSELEEYVKERIKSKVESINELSYVAISNELYAQNNMDVFKDAKIIEKWLKSQLLK